MAPSGVFLAPDGMYILEHLRMPLAILGDLGVGPYLRVRKVSRDGTLTELTRLWGRRSGAAAAILLGLAGLLFGWRIFRKSSADAVVMAAT